MNSFDVGLKVTPVGNPVTAMVIEPLPLLPPNVTAKVELPALPYVREPTWEPTVTDVTLVEAAA